MEKAVKKKNQEMKLWNCYSPSTGVCARPCLPKTSLFEVSNFVLHLESNLVGKYMYYEYLCVK